MMLNSKLSRLLGGLIIGLAPVWAGADEVSDENHRAFERKFADMCIEKEKSAMKGSGVLLSEVTSVCECIAREESKRVTKAEVREFVQEDRYPASLMMKSNAATYVCVESKK